MLRHPSSIQQLLRTVAIGQSSIRGHAVSATNNLVNLTVNDKTGIATLTLDRPPVNSLNYPLLKDFATALDDLEKNRSRGLILTSVSLFVQLFNHRIIMIHPKQNRTIIDSVFP